MARMFILLAAAFLIASCGGDDKKAKGKWYEECTVDADCEVTAQLTLVCASDLCVKKCSDTSECTSLDTNAACLNGYCFVTCPTRSVYDCTRYDKMVCLNYSGTSTCQPPQQ
jgi:hypothetical protein